ncbi:histone deacetylase family protein [Alteromonas gilva]|uniref:Histone deacetylase n=1 Tax=Alteromonas gilva TaxID=2987522 RepID=A0ABT5L6R0_9ALTE|nr:histone deacetylase [Alteromonas gilva]MDC8832711.1 histone deacetylase [Alteromonas gilva]
MTEVPPLVFHPIYSQLELPYRHRFPIEKYQGIYDALRLQGVPADTFVQPKPVLVNQLLAHYDSDYVNALLHGTLAKQAMRRIGFPWSEQLIKRSLTAVGGTITTARLAIQHGLALNLTGGYHHAAGDFGAGFCLFNDLYLAAKTMLNEPGIDSVLIIDLDVHQGDGTALLAENDPSVITLSLHGEKNFPHRKQRSDMDFPLPKGLGDDDYMNVLDEALTTARRLYSPDAVIYDAGVDVHEHDDLGLLNISTQGVLARDSMVFNWCKARDLPVAAVIGGGYQRDIDALVAVHLQLYRAAGVID